MLDRRCALADVPTDRRSYGHGQHARVSGTGGATSDCYAPQAPCSLYTSLSATKPDGWGVLTCPAALRVQSHIWGADAAKRAICCKPHANRRP